MDQSSWQTATIHTDSPIPVRTRDYGTTGDQIVNVVERALYSGLELEAARTEINTLHFITAGERPTKWDLFFDCANAIAAAAAYAHSEEHRLRLAKAGLPYLTGLLNHIKREEEAREKARGLFVTAREIARPDGVDYLINVFGDALTHNQDIHFE